MKKELIIAFFLFPLFLFSQNDNSDYQDFSEVGLKITSMSVFGCGLKFEANDMNTTMNFQAVGNTYFYFLDGLYLPKEVFLSLNLTGKDTKYGKRYAKKQMTEEKVAYFQFKETDGKPVYNEIEMHFKTILPFKINGELITESKENALQKIDYDNIKSIERTKDKKRGCINIITE